VVGVTRADLATIYEVCFNAIGAPGAQTTVTFGNLNPTSPADAYNASGTNVWTNGGANGPSGISDTLYIITTPAPLASVTFTADKDTAATGAQTCVDVKVKNFTNVTGAEFILNYDATKLQWQSNQFGTNPLNLIASNVVHTAGQIRFTWSNAAGVTLNDNTSIFSACFTVAAPSGTTTTLTFGSAACSGIGVFKKDFGGFPIATVAGSVFAGSQAGGPPSLAPTPVSCNGGTNGSITSTTTGPNPQSYAWAGPGINAGNQSVQNPSGLTAGTYTVTVTYVGGTTATATAIVTQPNVLAANSTVTTISCFGFTDGAITLNPNGGTSPYTYNWGNSVTTQNRTALAAGTYTVTITDTRNCQVTQSATVTEPQAISLPSAGTTITNIACFGNQNGAISITPNGGTAPFTYDWSNDGPDVIDNDPKDLTGLVAGTYTVTITDSRNCVFTSQGYSIVEPSVLATTFVSKTNAQCAGSATGQAQISVNGGTGNKTFCWKNTTGGNCVANVQNPTNLPPGTYNVTVTDANGCTAVLASNVVIDGPPSTLTVQSSSTPSPCFGQPAGSITLNVSGGWTGYTYAWSGALPPSANINGVSPGNYVVTVTDQNFCTLTQTVNVGGPQTAISIGTPVVQNVTCFGAGNGGINLQVSGGNPGQYDVIWSNTSLEGQAIGGLNPGTYQPQVTDANGCTAVFNPITITGPQPIVLDTNVVAANPTGSIDLIVTGGTPGYNYQWRNAGGTVVGVQQDLSNQPSGVYTVQVTDANGCSLTAAYSIPELNALNGTAISSSTNSCNNDGCINISIPTNAVGPFSISWTGSPIPMPTTSYTPSVCNLAAGPYNVTVTAANGNSVVLPTTTINQLQQAIVSSQTQNPFDELGNGKITLNPVPSGANLTYNWSPIASTANSLLNLDSGTYVVTITNQTSGCTTVQTFHLMREYAALSATATPTNPVCAGAATGSIVLGVTGGNDPYTYNWTGPNGFSKTTKDITALLSGVYNVTITDQNGTTRTLGPFVISSQSNLEISNVNELSNNNGWQVSGETMCDGEAAVVFGGGVGTTSIVWSNGVTGANNTTLCGGVYSVTVTDQLGCTAVWTDALTAPPAIALEQQSAGVSCYGLCNGSAKVNIEGGVEPYRVQWSTGQTDQLVFQSTFSEAVNLCGGNYTVTITDDNDVVRVFTVTVPEPAEITFDFSRIDPRSFNSCDGELILNAEGAVEPVTYTWSGSFSHSGDEKRAEGLCAGEVVQFVLTDANGCTAIAVDTVNYPEDGCFQVRPVITPGEQDGNNDFLLITCIETVPNDIEIYNRWGQLVFQTEDYTNNDSDPTHNWKGLTKSGEPLAEGVYYYILQYTDDQGNEHQLKGAINLLR
jgi:large repetitive protein